MNSVVRERLPTRSSPHLYRPAQSRVSQEMREARHAHRGSFDNVRIGPKVYTPR